MYFNTEINILDQYSFECEEVHMLVCINYCVDFNSIMSGEMSFE